MNQIPYVLKVASTWKYESRFNEETGNMELTVSGTMPACDTSDEYDEFVGYRHK